MQTINLMQGSPEWHAHRAQHFNASDAPAMMGCSPYTTRTELLSRLHIGIGPEVDPATQRIFDDGHRFEALARPLAEKIIGEDLFPVTGVEGRYSASFDGLTMMEDVAFEHKTLNDSLRDVMHADIKGFELPLHYQVQMEHQAMVSGCERILFMASKWNGDELVEERHCWYLPDLALRAKILAGWMQLEEDLKTFVPSTATPTPVAKIVGGLPVVFDMRVEGRLVACNLAQYKPAALAYIQDINTALSTDQDFADAEVDAKFCRESASKLKLAIEQALGQMGDVNTAISTVRDIAAAFDAKGLMLEKLVKARKDQIRMEIARAAQDKLADHVAKLNMRIGWINGAPAISSAAADFNGAIKGKKTVSSLRDACDTELARAKIATNELADRMDANIKLLKGEGHDWGFLFPDLGAVASKTAEDFANLLAARINAHQQAEDQRKQREAEAAAKASAVVHQAAQTATPAHVAAITDAVTTGTGIVRVTHEGIVNRIAPAQIFDDGRTIKLGDINARLAPIQITASGLAELGFEPVAAAKSAKLYRECDFPAMCTALIQHLESLTAAVE
jgi:putative phage-type endonuclease